MRSPLEELDSLGTRLHEALRELSSHFKRTQSTRALNRLSADAHDLLSLPLETLLAPSAIEAMSKAPSRAALYGLLVESEMYPRTRRMVQRGLASDPDYAADVFSDSLPLERQEIEPGQPSEEASLIVSQTMQVLRRAFDTHLGFGAQTLEARRFPALDQNPLFDRSSLLSQFLTQCGASPFALNAHAIDAFPGNGFGTKGLVL